MQRIFSRFNSRNKNIIVFRPIEFQEVSTAATALMIEFLQKNSNIKIHQTNHRNM